MLMTGTIYHSKDQNLQQWLLQKCNGEKLLDDQTEQLN